MFFRNNYGHLPDYTLNQEDHNANTMLLTKKFEGFLLYVKH
jgi:hypothetical protein